ncbi:MAG: response regulator [Proteobacteria bacterium]|nr:response regulator [Pseudomonadota bacterium]
MSKPLARVLLIEDEPTMARTIQFALNRQDIAVELCGTGEEALSILTVEPFDLMVLDINLPGMSGLDVVTELATNPAFHQIPFIFITGDASPANRKEAQRLGASDFLEKPLKLNSFVTCIRTHLKLEPTRQPKVPAAWRQKVA